jgi:cell division protein FtsW (lipid II flippase)
VFAQMTVNIGMTIGLLPITGVTLPFTSYGGSSLVSCWILTGLLLGIGIRPPTGGEKDPFDA